LQALQAARSRRLRPSPGAISPQGLIASGLGLAGHAVQLRFAPGRGRPGLRQAQRVLRTLCVRAQPSSRASWWQRIWHPWCEQTLAPGCRGGHRGQGVVGFGDRHIAHLGRGLAQQIGAGGHAARAAIEVAVEHRLRFAQIGLRQIELP
jgi:hypothetical protein